MRSTRKSWQLRAVPVLVGLALAACGTPCVWADEPETTVGVTWLPIESSFRESPDLLDYDCIRFSPDDRRLLFDTRAKKSLNALLWKFDENGFIEYVDDDELTLAREPERRLGVVRRSQFPRSRPGGSVDAQLFGVLNDGLLLRFHLSRAEAFLPTDDGGAPVRGRSPVRFDRYTSFYGAESDCPIGDAHGAVHETYLAQDNVWYVAVYDPSQMQKAAFTAPLGETGGVREYRVGRAAEAIAVRRPDSLEFLLRTAEGGGRKVVLPVAASGYGIGDVRLLNFRSSQFVEGDRTFATAAEFEEGDVEAEGLVFLDPATGAVKQRLALDSGNLSRIQPNAAGDVLLVEYNTAIEFLRLEDGKWTRALRDSVTASDTALRLLREASSFQLSHRGDKVAFVGRYDGEPRMGVLDLGAVTEDRQKRMDAVAVAKSEMLRALRAPLTGPPPSFERFVGSEIPFELRSVKHPPQLIYVGGGPEMDDAWNVEIDSADRWIKVDAEKDVLLLDSASGKSISLNAAHEQQADPLPYGVRGGASAFCPSGEKLVLWNSDARRLSFWNIARSGPILDFHDEDLRESIPDCPNLLGDCDRVWIIESDSAVGGRTRLLLAGRAAAALLDVVDGKPRLVAAGKIDSPIQSYSADLRFVYAVDDEGAIREYRVEEGGFVGARIIPGPSNDQYAYRLSLPFQFADVRDGKQYMRYRFDGERLSLHRAYETETYVRSVGASTHHATVAAFVDPPRNAPHRRELVMLDDDLKPTATIPLDIGFDPFCPSSDGRFVAAVGQGKQHEELWLFRVAE